MLNYQRALISAECTDSSYGERKLPDGLTPETGGKPTRSLIITTWRSGSTFLGDILNALPGNYYHYEPLLDFDIVQIRGPPNDSVALHNLRHLLHCDYSEMENYLEFGRTHNYLFSHNTRLWQQCVRFPQFCYEPRFLGPFCRLFPRQSMKVVRLRAALVTPLLEDERYVLVGEWDGIAILMRGGSFRSAAPFGRTPICIFGNIFAMVFFNHSGSFILH